MASNGSTELLDPAVLMKIGPLEMVANRVVEGFLSGRHRSPYKGGCIEFAEHRPYSSGDELRLVDWRLLARRDRYYIKQFQEETNLQAVLVLDASGSMAFGDGDDVRWKRNPLPVGANRAAGMSKLRFAQVVSACLARLLIQQRDAVGLAVIDSKVRTIVPPRSSPVHLQGIMKTLIGTAPGGETSLAGNLDRLARRFKRRGLMIVVSDGLEEVEALLKALRHLRARGHDLIFLHVMAPEEINFPISQRSWFECLETGERLELDPTVVRKRYLERVQVFLKRIKAGCEEIGCDYILLRTDQPPGDGLAFCLARRAARVK